MTKAFPEVETRGLVLMKGLYSMVSPADHHTTARIQKRKIIRKTLQQVVDKRHAVSAVADTMKALDFVTSRLQHVTVRRRSHYGASRFKSLETLIDAHVKEVLGDQKKSVDGSGSGSVAADPLVPRLRHLSMNDEDPLSSRLGNLSVNDADAVAIGSYSDPTWVQFRELSVKLGFIAMQDCAHPDGRWPQFRLLSMN